MPDLDDAQKELLWLSVLGIITGIYWSVYVLWPNNLLLIRIGVALNGAWVVAYGLTVLTIAFGGFHLMRRIKGII